MQGIHEFIIEIKHPFKNTISHGNLELWVDSDFDRFQHSNRVGTVISTPLNEYHGIAEGDEVMIVQTVVMPHITKDGRQPSPHLVDAIKGWYRAEPSLVVMHKKPDQEWRSFDRNVFLERIEESEEAYERSGIIYQTKIEKLFKPYSRVAFASHLLDEHGIKVGDKVYHSPDLHEYEIDGKTYYRTPIDFIYGKREE